MSKFQEQRIRALEKNYIVDVGSNENGSYIKFSDGTLEQYGTISNTTTGQPRLTFPLPFVNNDFNIQLTNRYYANRWC